MELTRDTSAPEWRRVEGLRIVVGEWVAALARRPEAPAQTSCDNSSGQKVIAVPSCVPAPVCSKCGNTLGCVSCYNEAHAPAPRTFPKEREIEDWRGWQKKLMEILGMNGTESWSDLCAVRGLIAEIERLKAQATIAKLQWTEIAPDNLPLDRDYLLYRKFQGSDVFSVGYFSPKSGWWLIDGEIMRGNSGYTHFCPISPPAQITIETLNVQKGSKL